MAEIVLATARKGPGREAPWCSPLLVRLSFGVGRALDSGVRLWTPHKCASAMQSMAKRLSAKTFPSLQGKEDNEEVSTLGRVSGALGCTIRGWRRGEQLREHASQVYRDLGGGKGDKTEDLPIGNSSDTAEACSSYLLFSTTKLVL